MGEIIKKIGNAVYYIIIAAVLVYIIYSGKYLIIYGTVKRLFVTIEKPYLSWEPDYSHAMARVKAENKPLFVLITAPDWCSYCKALEATTLQSEHVASFVYENYVALQILDTSPERKNFSYNSYPTILILSAEGKELERVKGFIGDRMLLSLLKEHSGK
ncbi:MAG: thioredoxin family protein [Spirochaetes bacterium]|nr:thioredoxin family protein [Spirochaetota bacterium]MBN2772185.1 thioredoxin family protein [Spirochaetota bacterium]